jgi:hypothetical protein
MADLRYEVITEISVNRHRPTANGCKYCPPSVTFLGKFSLAKEKMKGYFVLSKPIKNPFIIQKSPL